MADRSGGGCDTQYKLFYLKYVLYLNSLSAIMLYIK